MKHKRTLCIFSPAFPKDEADSTWLPWLQSFVKNINSNFPFIDVVIFSFQYPSTTLEYKWYNNLVIPFNGRSKTKIERLWMWFKIINKFHSIKKERYIEGIFSLWCGETTLLAKCCSKLFNVKFFCWILGGDARPGNKYVKWIRPKGSELIAMSDFLRDEFNKNYGVKPFCVIPNGIDVSTFAVINETKSIDIVGAGSLSALKRYDMFVEIIRALKHRFPNIQTVLCGGGEQENELKELVRKYDLEENVLLTGEIPHQLTLSYMQKAKVFLHPSSYEGFSTVCLEAMYAGAKVISFVQPMHHHIDNWFIVKTKEEMIKKTVSILENKDEKYESKLVYALEENVKKILMLFQT